MIPFIETHCHLTWDSFQGDVDDVIARARKAGIIAILDLGTDLATSEGAKNHAETYPDVSFGAGIHPNDAAAAREEELTPLLELLHHPKCVALGEIGLDFSAIIPHRNCRITGYGYSCVWPESCRSLSFSTTGKRQSSC